MEADEILAKKHKLAQQAEDLLNNRMVQGFFESKLEACYKAFMGLPVGATLEQYITVHTAYTAVSAMKQYFEGYVKDYENESMANAPDVDEGILI